MVRQARATLRPRHRPGTVETLHSRGHSGPDTVRARWKRSIAGHTQAPTPSGPGTMETVHSRGHDWLAPAPAPILVPVPCCCCWTGCCCCWTGLFLLDWLVPVPCCCCWTGLFLFLLLFDWLVPTTGLACSWLVAGLAGSCSCCWTGWFLFLLLDWLVPVPAAV